MTDCARCLEQCGDCCCFTRSSAQEAPVESLRYNLEHHPNFFIPDTLPRDIDWNTVEFAEIDWTIILRGEQMTKCTYNGCEREAEPTITYCSAHGITCVWCRKSFAKRETYPYDCPGCGVTLSEQHTDYWETWAQIAVRKGRPVPDGKKPDGFVNDGATARLTRGLKDAGNYIGWLNDLRLRGVSETGVNGVHLNHIATTVGVLIDAFELRVREADQRDVWYGLSKRLLAENEKLKFERDAAQRLLDSLTKTVEEPEGDDPDPAF